MWAGQVRVRFFFPCRLGYSYFFLLWASLGGSWGRIWRVQFWDYGWASGCRKGLLGPGVGPFSFFFGFGLPDNPLKKGALFLILGYSRV